MIHCFCQNYLRTDQKLVLVCCKCHKQYRPFELDERDMCSFEKITITSRKDFIPKVLLDEVKAEMLPKK